MGRALNIRPCGWSEDKVPAHTRFVAILVDETDLYVVRGKHPMGYELCVCCETMSGERFDINVVTVDHDTEKINWRLLFNEMEIIAWAAR